MLKCLILSDSHGYRSMMQNVMKRHRDAEVLFFLGDGLSDLEEAALYDAANGICRQYLAVRGNCDFCASFRGATVPKVDGIELLGHRIVLTHGDLYGAKYGEEGLLRLAREKGAEIVLFGHTHAAYETFVREEENGVYLFNHGSISGSGSPAYSYGLMTLTETSVLLSHGTIL